MMTRPGMTLIEVLAATALLALVAGTCVSALQSITASFKPNGDVITWAELGSIADRVVTNPEAFDLDLAQMIEQSVNGQRTLQIGTDPTKQGSVRLLRPDSTDTGHTWLEIGVGGRSAYRWLPLLQTKESSQ